MLGFLEVIESSMIKVFNKELLVNDVFVCN